MLYAGIDLGTSSVKLLLMDKEGTIINTVTEEYPIYFPKTGWAEQNPEDWYRSVMNGMKRLLEGADRRELAGISFGGQMHGLVVLDENNNVIRPCILWNDGRTQEECDYLNQQIGKKIISSYTANIAFAGFTAPKILWMKKNEPENFKRIKKIMLPKDYLAYMLTGVFSTDVSDASGTLLFDVKNRCWSQEMCTICGITEEMLPKVYESYECIGTVLHQTADELGINAEVKVAAGAGDNAAAAVATGTVGEGKCNGLHSFCDANGKYHLMGCMLSAASCNKWWMEDILYTKDYEKEQSIIENLGGNQVYFLPYLMGERSPHNNPDARGTFIGMSMDTGRGHMTQAVLEGVAFAFRDMLEISKRSGIKVESTKVCGGGAKSRLWLRILANVLNLRLEIPEREEGPSLGAAMLAAVACGEYKTVEEAAEKIVKIKEFVEPEKKLVENYDRCYETFRQIYPACKGIYDLIKNETRRKER